MQLSGFARYGPICCAGVVLAGCGSDRIIDIEDEDPEPNLIVLQSDPGDTIGLGRTYTYTLANSTMDVFATANALHIGIVGDEHWTGDFQLPTPHTRLAPGEYTGMWKFPALIEYESRGALSWKGEGRECGTVSGSLTIDRVTYSTDGISAIDLSFVQRCDGVTPALRGRVHWHDADETVPPGPVFPIPAGVWAPPPHAIPASGTVVYLTSDPGDFILGGATETYTPANAVIHASASGNWLRVTMDTGAAWNFEFKTMSSVDALEPGYYADVRRYPFHNPAKGGLTASGRGRGCNTLTGWYAIDQVEFASGVLASVTLRFEQHCEGEGPAMRGYIRWNG